MFFSGIFGGAALSLGMDPEQERDPPPPATPLTFPDYIGCETSSRDGSMSMPDFGSLFTRVAKPADIAQVHVDALNIEICPAQDIEDLVPPDSNGKSYFPPLVLTPDQAMKPEAYAEETQGDPKVGQQRNEFQNRLAELRIDNDTAFRSLMRTMKNGARAHKLAYMRKFWEGLESMSQYWDSSLDQYYEVTGSSKNNEQSAKRQRLDVAQNRPDQSISSAPVSRQDDSTPKVPLDATETQNQKPESVSTSAHDSSDDELGLSGHKIRSDASNPEAQPRLRYKGRRTHTGREIPDQFRTETVRAFVEGTVWAFQCSVAPPRLMPIVQFGKLNLPVRQSAAVYRQPKERMRARSGRVEGPMVAVQVRADTDFIDGDGNRLLDKSRLDLMRELGGLLQLAQERRREGKAEVKPGEGKWWTTKPRWGGGAGGEVQNEEGNTDIMQVADDVLGQVKGEPKVEAPKVKREKDGSRVRKKKTPAELWKELRCGSSYWDPKTDYAAIGKDPSSPYDEIFMVSSLNRHICVVKLTVHEAYVDSLATGAAPVPPPEDSQWCRPRLQRSQWFDLFDMDQRIDAFRGLWGIMAYLSREVGPKECPDLDVMESCKGEQNVSMAGTE
ncbi:hypothetical protein EJ03DRAFT_285864 [Teratosphaeria nubilosa]|uniref:Uncharacterized protein n=1 Tax=Teratosphaeria nubilosa TaxID=161662 RepID=A0A6G1LLC2_9PEZI|nr:hypothetical protein EJ03DRAFT_285864 [Teratosphaeria nubilosa]